jgi:hypothetical protein
MVSPLASATPGRLFARGYTKLALRIDREDAIPNFLRALGGDVRPPSSATPSVHCSSSGTHS